MSSMATVSVEERHDVAVAHVSGEIDMTNALDVERLLESAVPPDAAGLVIDLTEVTYLNSTMIKSLFDLSERLRRRHQDLRVAMAEHAQMRRLLLLVNLHHIIPLDSTVEEAVVQIRARGVDRARRPDAG